MLKRTRAKLEWREREFSACFVILITAAGTAKIVK
jgi:hypothetical protein